MKKSTNFIIGAFKYNDLYSPEIGTQKDHYEKIIPFLPLKFLIS